MSDIETTLSLSRVELFELDPGPLPMAFRDATMGPFSHWKLTWLRITSEDGLTGEAPGGGATPELAQILVDEGPRTVEQWWQRLWWLRRNAGHRNPDTTTTLTGIDTALRDILAHRAGQPWHRFNGATRDEVPVYGSGCGTNLALDQLTDQARSFVDAGYNTIKMKVGTNFGTEPDTDVARVEAVREAVGPDVGLAVDSNQTWTADQALDFAHKIEPFNIAWFEEPVHSADLQGQRELSASCPIDVAMGESECHWLGFEEMVRAGVQHPQPAASKLSSLPRWHDAVDAIEAAGCKWSSGGLTPMTGQYVATRDSGLVEFLIPIIGHLNTCFAELPKIEDGVMKLGDRPGLQMAVDWEGLEAKGRVTKLLDVHRI